MKNFFESKSGAPAGDGVETKRNEIMEKPIEKRIGKIDDIFDNLIDKVKDAPELKKKALEICIQQFRQIAEQMKQVRDMENLQELKKIMMEHWKELNILADGDVELLTSIQEWGNEFVDQKAIYNDIVGGAKDELLDKAQEVEHIWNDILLSLSTFQGKVTILNDSLTQFLEGAGGYFHHQQDSRTPLDMFFQNINDPESFYAGDGLAVEEAAKFMAGLNRVIAELEQSRQGKLRMERSPERRKELEALGLVLKDVIEKKGQLSRQIREISKSFKFIKKVKDIHFLKLFNKQQI